MTPRKETEPTKEAELDRYDAGLLNDFGGGNVQWWQDYIRAELERAHDHYHDQLARRDEARDAALLKPWREGVKKALDWCQKDYNGVKELEGIVGNGCAILQDLLASPSPASSEPCGCGEAREHYHDRNDNRVFTESCAPSEREKAREAVIEAAKRHMDDLGAFEAEDGDRRGHAEAMDESAKELVTALEALAALGDA